MLLTWSFTFAEPVFAGTPEEEAESAKKQKESDNKSAKQQKESDKESAKQQAKSDNESAKQQAESDKESAKQQAESDAGKKDKNGEEEAKKAKFEKEVAKEKSKLLKEEARDKMKQLKKDAKEEAKDATEKLLDEFNGDKENPEFKQKLEEIKQKRAKAIQQADQEFVEAIQIINQERKTSLEDIKQKYRTLEFEVIENVEEQEKSQEMKKSKIKQEGILVKKTDKKIQKLLQSDNPENEALKLNLDYKNGKIKIVLELSNTNPQTIEKIQNLADIDVQNGNLVQVTALVDDIPRITSLGVVEKTRTPFSLSDYEPLVTEGVVSSFVETTVDEVVFDDLKSFVNEELLGEDVELEKISEFEKEILDGVGTIHTELERVIIDYDVKSRDGSYTIDEASHDLLRLSNTHESTLTGLKQEVSDEISKIESNENLVDTDRRDRLVQLATKIERISQMRNVIAETQLKPSTTESVYFGNADIVHDSGIKGNDVKIAVLDLSFDITNPKIADKIAEAKSFRNGFETTFVSQDENGNNLIAHGTAVAEIVSEMAPEADLFLYEMDTDVEFAVAVDQAIANDVDVIAMAAGWPNLPTDGSSHITKKVEEAISHGITFVVPAGNFAMKHWEGQYSDSNMNGWHEFESKDEGMSITVDQLDIVQQKPIMVYLHWDDGIGDLTDFDLILVDPLGQIVEFSADKQSSSTDKKLESIFYVPEVAGIYALGIQNSEEIDTLSEIPTHSTLELFSVNHEIEYDVASGSVVVPGDANGVIVVGAISSLDGTLEPFSSQGPTNNGKLAPHFVGPDGITTVAYGGNLFFGTSATTPYVTGIAALMLETNSELTPNQLLNIMQENAKLDSSLKDVSYQNSFGYGTIDALFLINE